MRFGFSFPLFGSVRGFASFNARGMRRGGTGGSLLWCAFFILFLLFVDHAWGRPCATCATITNPIVQDLARDRAAPRNTNAGSTCATISNPTAQALCRARQR